MIENLFSQCLCRLPHIMPFGIQNPVSPDGRTLIGVSDDSIEFRDVQTGQVVGHLTSPSEFHTPLTITSNWEKIALVLPNGNIEVRSLQTGDILRRIWWAGGDNLGAIAFSSTSRTLIKGGYTGQIQLFNAQTGLKIRTLRPRMNRIIKLIVTSNGNSFVSISRDDYSTNGIDSLPKGEIRLWDFHAGKPLWSMEVFGYVPLAISSDSQTLFISSPPDSVKQIDLASGLLIRTLNLNLSNPTGMCLSPDAHYLFISYGERVPSMRSAIQVWNLETDEVANTLESNDNIGFSDIAISTNGQIIAANGQNGVSVWRLLKYV